MSREGEFLLNRYKRYNLIAKDDVVSLKEFENGGLIVTHEKKDAEPYYCCSTIEVIRDSVDFKLTKNKEQ